MGVSSARKENARLRRTLQMVQAQNMSLSSALKAFDAVNTEGVDVASASQIDLRAIGGAIAWITGTTSISSIVEQEAGQIRRLLFEGSLTLVHNATSFNLPGDQPIVTVAGDSAGFVSLGSGNWKCFLFTRGGSPTSPLYSGLWANFITDSIGTDGVDYTYDNGSAGAGATISFTAVGAKTIGGDTPALGATIIYNQTFPNAYTGIYEITRKGTGAVTEIWTRSPIMDTANKFVGATVFVINGGVCFGLTIRDWTLWGYTDFNEPVVGTSGGQFEFVNDLYVTGDVSFNSLAPTAVIGNDKVTTLKMLNNAVTFAKMQAITDGKLLGANGGTAVEEITVGVGLALAANTLSVAVPYVLVQDQQTTGTDGGTFTSGADRTRVINTEVTDTGSICSIASNQITLAAGTYECLIFCPAVTVGRHQAWLYNVTDTALTLSGGSAQASVAGTASTPSIIQGRFVIAAQKTFEIRHRCTTTGTTTGFGTSANFASAGHEVYTSAEFRKVA